MSSALRGKGSRLLLRLSLTLALITSLSFPFNSPATASLPRSLVDRSDDLKGAQIHLVYVAPNDARDQEWDVNGQYKKWIDRAQDWLNSQIGRRLKFDTHNGQLDITFLRSKLTTQEMITRSSTSTANVEGVLDTLIREYLAQSPERDYKNSPKTYMFMISENIKPGACGWAGMPSILALGYTGATCWQGPADDERGDGSIPWPSTTIVHEVFHTYGVGHTCDDVQDLMWGSGCPGGRTSNVLYIDRDRVDYFGGEKSGVDISKLPIWLDSPNTSAYANIKSKSAYAPKLSNGDFVFEIGKPIQSISWDWERFGGRFNGGFIECTLTSGDTTITTSSTDGLCTFEVPLTWRGGRVATAKGKAWMGPFYGESSTLIKLWNPDRNFSACSDDFCFEREVQSLDSNYCYGTDHKFFTLEQYSAGTWKPLVVTESRPTTRCTGTYWEPTPAEVEFTSGGSFIYRWVAGDTSISRISSEPARIINILKNDAPYLLASAKESQLAIGKSILDEVKAKIARDDLCKSSKGCYVGELLTAPIICFASDVGLMELELFRDGKWQTIFSGPTKKGENNCGQSFSTPTYRMTFNEPGIQSFRWKTVPGGKHSFTTTKYDVMIEAIQPNKSGANPLSTAQYATTKVSALSEAVIRSRAETAAKAKAEEDARLASEAAAKAKAEEEARLKAEAEGKAKAEEEARIKAEAEAKAKAAEEARLKAEAEAKAKAEEEARIKAEAEAKAKAAEEARLKAEAEAKAKAEAAQKAKRTTIICVKGKATKRVTGSKPKCPDGFRIKR